MRGDSPVMMNKGCEVDPFILIGIGTLVHASMGPRRRESSALMSMSCMSPYRRYCTTFATAPLGHFWSLDHNEIIVPRSPRAQLVSRAAGYIRYIRSLNGTPGGGRISLARRAYDVALRFPTKTEQWRIGFIRYNIPSSRELRAAAASV